MTQPTARHALLDALTDPPEWDADIIGLPETEANRLLDAYRAQVREEVAQEIDAATERNMAEHPDEPAMSTRRLGLRAAARIARAVQEG